MIPLPWVAAGTTRHGRNQTTSYRSLLQAARACAQQKATVPGKGPGAGLFFATSLIGVWRAWVPCTDCTGVQAVVRIVGPGGDQDQVLSRSVLPVPARPRMQRALNAMLADITGRGRRRRPVTMTGERFGGPEPTRPAWRAGAERMTGPPVLPLPRAARQPQHPQRRQSVPDLRRQGGRVPRLPPAVCMSKPVPIVGQDGGHAGARRGLVRTLAFPLSFRLLGPGFISILFDRDRRALPELIAGTAVIYARDAREVRLRSLARQSSDRRRKPHTRSRRFR
jgi:hypothetical protein